MKNLSIVIMLTLIVAVLTAQILVEDFKLFHLSLALTIPLTVGINWLISYFFKQKEQ